MKGHDSTLKRILVFVIYNSPVLGINEVDVVFKITFALFSC